MMADSTRWNSTREVCLGHPVGARRAVCCAFRTPSLRRARDGFQTLRRRLISSSPCGPGASQRPSCKRHRVDESTVGIGRSEHRLDVVVDDRTSGPDGPELMMGAAWTTPFSTMTTSLFTSSCAMFVMKSLFSKWGPRRPEQRRGEESKAEFGAVLRTSRRRISLRSFFGFPSGCFGG